MSMSTIALSTNNTGKIQPKKFALWLAIASMIMFFAAFTSAYIVRKAAGNWDPFRLPAIFTYSTMIILMSSASMHFALRAFRSNNFPMFRLLLGTTLGLGIIFLICQYIGWLNLIDIGVYLVGNISGSFLYLITAAHAAHIVG